MQRPHTNILHQHQWPRPIEEGTLVATIVPILRGEGSRCHLPNGN